MEEGPQKGPRGVMQTDESEQYSPELCHRTVPDPTDYQDRHAEAQRLGRQIQSKSGGYPQSLQPKLLLKKVFLY